MRNFGSPKGISPRSLIEGYMANMDLDETTTDELKGLSVPEQLTALRTMSHMGIFNKKGASIH